MRTTLAHALAQGDSISGTKLETQKMRSQLESCEKWREFCAQNLWTSPGLGCLGITIPPRLLF